MKSKIPSVAARCCYNFSTLAQKLQKEMAPHASDILKGTV